MLPPVLDVMALPVGGKALLVETGVVWNAWLWVAEEVLNGCIVEKVELAPEVIVIPVKGIPLLVGATVVVTSAVVSLPVSRLEKVVLLSIEVNKEEISVETEPSRSARHAATLTNR